MEVTFRRRGGTADGDLTLNLTLIVGDEDSDDERDEIGAGGSSEGLGPMCWTPFGQGIIFKDNGSIYVHQLLVDTEHKSARHSRNSWSRKRGDESTGDGHIEDAQWVANSERVIRKGWP